MPDWGIVAIIAIVVIFGAAKLPQIARNMGKAQNEFKKGLREGAGADDDTSASTPPAAAPAPAPAPQAPAAAPTPAPTPQAPTESSAVPPTDQTGPIENPPA
jgi:sec-independent protein translocase protein TatA